MSSHIPNPPDRIEELARRKHYSLKDCADAIGISQRGLYYNRKHGSLSWTQIILLAQFLDCEVQDLFIEPCKTVTEGKCPHCGRPIAIVIKEK